MLEKLSALFLKQQERWILWAPVAMALGVGLYFSLHFEPSLWVGIVSLALLLGFITPFYKNRKVVWYWLPLFLIALGFLSAQVRTAMVAAPVLLENTYPLLIEARVSDIQKMPDTYRLVVSEVKYDLTNDRQPQDDMPTRLRIRLKKDTDIIPKVGDVIAVKVMLLPLSPPVLPGAYDFQRHAFFKGIGATGFAISDVDIIEPHHGGYFFEHLRDYLGRHIRAAMHNQDAAGITTALLYGEEQNISDETYDKIRAGGIAHLIAISGLQITLVTGFFFFLVRAILASIPYIALRYPVKKMAAFIAMCGAVFYMLLIGDAISAERSVIMVCIVMLAIMLDRDPFTLRLAAFAAVFLLLFQPESLFGPGFQMSFAAVVALIAFYEATRHWWIATDDRSFIKRVGYYIMGSLATTLVATLATAPFALYHFLKTPLFPGLVANLIAVPLSSFVTMPFAIIGCLLMPLGLEHIPLKIAEWSVLVIIQTADMVSKWPFAVYKADAWSIGILAVMAFGGLWLAIWQGRVRWVGVLPILLSIVLINTTPRADILVADEGKLFAVRDEKNVLWLSSERSQKFAQEAWIEREAEEGFAYWPKTYTESLKSPLRCDEEACLYRTAGKLISFVREYPALAKDCDSADIIITNLRVNRRHCDKPITIVDQKDLQQKQAHALYFKADGKIDIRTVFDERGIRPWVGDINKF